MTIFATLPRSVQRALARRELERRGLAANRDSEDWQLVIEFYAFEDLRAALDVLEAACPELQRTFDGRVREYPPGFAESFWAAEHPRLQRARANMDAAPEHFVEDPTLAGAERWSRRQAWSRSGRTRTPTAKHFDAVERLIAQSPPLQNGNQSLSAMPGAAR